ncbi:uncharacterized protein LOC135813440 [Sycon ciliatum]|uniref:uncharacterized protein LOC135813440 n=1 Tax=Sycon ciliatum TaxID=27933 RepID=UPI0031F6CB6D
MMFGVYMVGGDIHHGGSSGGESIYGPRFLDENYIVQHQHAGIVGMINCGAPHTNASQFYITISPAPFMDGKNVGIGQVVEGLDVVKKIVRVAGVPEVKSGLLSRVAGSRKPVLIESCGQLDT